MTPAERSPAATPGARRWRLTGPRAGLALFLVSLALQVPFLDRGISHLDEGSILAIAERLRHGEVLYRDRSTFVAPLTYELLRLLFDVFGPSFLVARILQALVFSGCVVLVYALLRAVAGGRAAAAGAIAMLALKSWAFPAWTMLNYSQVAMLLCLTTVWAVSRFLDRRRAGWLALAAVALGVTVLAKQNLGVLLGFTVAATVAADAWYDGAPLSALLLRWSALGLAALPIAVAAVAYAAQGALGDLVAHTILRVPAVAAQYGIPLPVAVVWSADRGAFMAASFPYFPPPLFHVGWQEHWDIARFPASVAIELAVKGAYFVPLFAILWCVVAARRGFRRRSDRTAWSRLVLITTFAAVAYASMLYRADWIHLMNVYPPLLIACVVAFRGAAPPSRRRVLAGVAVLALWVALGVLLAVLTFWLYRAPLETPRGRLLVPRYEADDTARVLDYAARVPPGVRLAFMRHEPLYYFLTGREIPIEVDLVLPGYVGPDDDERIAAELARVDEVVFSPKFLPTVAAPLTAYAPRTASVLANDFRIADVLGPGAVVLRRRAVPVARGAVVVVDLWDRFEELRPEVRVGERVDAVPAASQSEVAPVTWLVLRVVRTIVVKHEAATCFALRHTVGAREEIVTTPLADPALWRGTERDLMPGTADTDVHRARFDIAVTSGARTATVFSEERPLASPGEPIEVPLEGFTGQTVDVRFCAAAAPAGGAGPTRVPVGWAEPRIVRVGG